MAGPKESVLMAVGVEFDDPTELVALLRAGVELKFERCPDDDVLAGSVSHADAPHRLRDALIADLRRQALFGRADRMSDWYALENQRQRRPTIVRRAGPTPHGRPSPTGNGTSGSPCWPPRSPCRRS
jgi:hypothetical protein